MTVLDQFVSVFEHIGAVATGLQRGLSYFLAIGLLASLYLAFSAYSPDSALWWNAIKCLVVCLPAMVWLVVWFVLGQLREAPNTVNTLVQDKDRMIQHFSGLDLDKAKSMKGAYSTLRLLSQQDGLEDVMGTISGVGLIINPLFAVLALLACGGLVLIIIIASMMWLF